jgi:hypothetical protein
MLTRKMTPYRYRTDETNQCAACAVTNMVYVTDSFFEKHFCLCEVTLLDELTGGAV